MNQVQHGNFSLMAQYYSNRPGYNPESLKFVYQKALQLKSFPKDLKVADLGAGTGKLTEALLKIGCHVDSVEPNSEMFTVGKTLVKNPHQHWHQAYAEKTDLPSHQYDWVLMGSSFHWTDPQKSLPEFHRLLKPNGLVTLVWNPRNIEKAPLEKTVEGYIQEMIGSIQRVSSGEKTKTKDWLSVLESTGHFKNTFFEELSHEEQMTPERYVGAWKSVNDIRVQLGEENFERFIQKVSELAKEHGPFLMPYKMTLWTGIKVDL